MWSNSGKSCRITCCLAQNIGKQGDDDRNDRQRDVDGQVVIIRRIIADLRMVDQRPALKPIIGGQSSALPAARSDQVTQSEEQSAGSRVEPVETAWDTAVLPFFIRSGRMRQQTPFRIRIAVHVFGETRNVGQQSLDRVRTSGTPWNIFLKNSSFKVNWCDALKQESAERYFCWDNGPN